MEGVGQIVKACDMFGQSIIINFKNKSEYKTIFGGTISIITFILVALLSSRQAQKLISRESFQINTEDLINMDPPQVNISQKNFVFAMRIQDANMGQYKNFFDIQLSQRMSKINQTTNQTDRFSVPINLTKCTMDHFSTIEGRNLTTQFKSFDLKDYLCAPINSTFQLQGNYNSDIFSFLKVEVKECTSNCESEENRKKYLDSFNYYKINFLVSTYQVNPTSKETINLFLYDQIYFTFLPYKYYTKADFFIRSSKILEDRSIVPFLQDDFQQEIIQLTYEDVRGNQVYESPQKLFGEYYFRISAKQTLIKKTYSKVDDFLAYVGGILKLAFSLVALIVVHYNYFDLFVNIANRLYNFDIPGQENSIRDTNNKITNWVGEIIQKEESLEKRKMHENVQAFLTQQKPERQDESENNKNRQEHKIDKNLIKDIPEMKDQHNFIQYVCQEVLKCKKMLKIKVKYLLAILFQRRFFYKDDIECQMIDTAYKLVKKEFDAVSMIERFQLVDNLKILLLNNNQIQFLESIPKPVIKPRNQRKLKREKTNQKKIHKNTENLMFLNLMQQLFEAYEKLILSHQKQHKIEQMINKSLYRMINKVTMKIFNFTLLLPDVINKGELQKLRYIDFSSLHSDKKKEEEKENENINKNEQGNENGNSKKDDDEDKNEKDGQLKKGIIDENHIQKDGDQEVLPLYDVPEELVKHEQKQSLKIDINPIHPKQ